MTVPPRKDTTDRLSRPVRWATAVASAALPEVRPAQLCENAADAGLRGIEWGVGTGQALAFDVSHADVAALGQAQDRFGLACCGVAVHDEHALSASTASWKRVAAAAADLRAPHVRVYATPLLDSGRSSERFRREFTQLQDDLARAAEVMAQAGTRLLLEPAPATMVPSPALAVAALMLADQDHVGVVYDPGSLAREGWLDPFLTTDVLGPLLRHVHAKNTAPRRAAHGRWQWERSDLTGGIVDWPSVFQALGAAQYEGWVVLDHLVAHTQAELRAEAACLAELTEQRHDS